MEVVEELRVKCAIYGNADNLNLNDLCSEMNVYLKTLSRNYIYQMDTLILRVVNGNNSDEIKDKIQGSCRIGDYVIDEWFIVYQVFLFLILQETRKWHFLIFLLYSIIIF